MLKNQQRNTKTGAINELTISVVIILYCPCNLMGTAYLFTNGETIVNDEMEVYFENDKGSYLESVIHSRYILYKTNNIDWGLIDKIDELVHLELDLAIIGARKAMSEVNKATVTPLKSV